jgi:hypothetical protein
MNSTTRRIITTAAAAGVLSLGTALPVSAAPDPGATGSGGNAGATTTGNHHTRTVRNDPSAIVDHPTRTVRNDPSTIVVREVVDDDAVAYVQIGLGALAGMALAGAAAVGLRRRERHTPHPA